MPWTHNLKVRYLIQLPWTIAVTRDSAGGYLAEVAELPFLLASGNCEKEAPQLPLNIHPRSHASPQSSMEAELSTGQIGRAHV